jgi:hypothetical protein
MTTEVNQTFASSSEIHEGAVYWAVDTSSFDKTRQFIITNQGYVSAAHEDLEFPAMAGEGTAGNGGAIMDFTLNGNGGQRMPTTAAFTEHRLRPAYRHLERPDRVGDQRRGRGPVIPGRVHRVPGQPRPDPAPLGRLQLGNLPPRRQQPVVVRHQLHPVPQLHQKAFTPTIGTCGGTRDGLANWGTSVNYVVP